jgi:two-component system, cell cycle response regulator
MRRDGPPSGEDGESETQIIRTRQPPEEPVVVVRATFGSGRLSHWVARAGEVARVGRSPEADLVLADPSVSRFHARIEVDPLGNLVLVDLESTNGTFVNQAPLRGRARIEPGDRVLFGTVAVSIERMTRAELDALRTAATRLDEANRDPLTGLVARRWLEGDLGAWLERYRQQGEPVCCLFVDLDQFKDVNDQSGHAAGDEVLRQVADLLRRAIRNIDVAVRLGGDEIVVFLAKCRLPEAMAVAERVRGAVEGHDFGAGIGAGRVTLSIGAAEHRGEAPPDWIRRADAALYRAKTSRNRTVAAE